MLQYRSQFANLFVKQLCTTPGSDLLRVRCVLDVFNQIFVVKENHRSCTVQYDVVFFLIRPFTLRVGQSTIVIQAQFVCMLVIYS